MIRNSNLGNTYLLGYDASKYITINNDANLNDLTSPGVYCCHSASTTQTLINSPLQSSAFKMIVEAMSGDTSIVSQKIVVINNMQTTPYVRTRQSSGNWSTWYQLATKSDLPKFSVVNFSWNPPGEGKYIDLNISIINLGISSGDKIISITASTGSTNAYCVIRTFTTETVWVRIYQISGIGNSVNGSLRVLYY